MTARYGRLQNRHTLPTKARTLIEFPLALLESLSIVDMWSAFSTFHGDDRLSHLLKGIVVANDKQLLKGLDSGDRFS